MLPEARDALRALVVAASFWVVSFWAALTSRTYKPAELRTRGLPSLAVLRCGRPRLGLGALEEVPVRARLASK